VNFNETLKNLKNYEAGKPIELVVREYGINPKNIIKLASNENPYGVGKNTLKAIISHAKEASIYPDDSYYELKAKLSKKFDLFPENFIIGAGSDQVLEFVSFAVLNENKCALMNKVTFAMYEIYAKMAGAKVIKTSSLEHDLNEFLRLYKKHKPSLIFICTPDNPTGYAIKKDKLFSFLQKIDNDTLVIIDGAYMEYAKKKDLGYFIEPKELIKNFKNVLYTGTFSKAYSLGGMRIGYGISNPQIIKILHKLRPPFNITTLSLSCAIASFKDEDFVQKSIKKNFEQMKRYEKFAKENNIKYIKSFTNFITYIFKTHSSTKVANKLLKKGIIVRDLSSYALNGIRITIGTKKQNNILLKTLREVLIG